MKLHVIKEGALIKEILSEYITYKYICLILYMFVLDDALMFRVCHIRDHCINELNYDSVGCSYKHGNSGSWLYDLDLQWTDWLTFTLYRTCGAQMYTDVTLLQDHMRKGRAISVVMGSKSNTLMYIRYTNSTNTKLIAANVLMRRG